jgi:hypothetical protein
VFFRFFGYEMQICLDGEVRQRQFSGNSKRFLRPERAFSWSATRNAPPVQVFGSGGTGPFCRSSAFEAPALQGEMRLLYKQPPSAACFCRRYCFALTGYTSLIPCVKMRDTNCD